MNPLNNSTIINYQLGSGNRLVSTTSSATNLLFVSGTANEPIGTDPRWGELWITNLTACVGGELSVNGKSFHASLPANAGATNRIHVAIRDRAGNMGYALEDYYVGTSGTLTASSSYQYNAAGCLTNLNGASLEWDERYRLTSVSSATSVVHYAYDVQGRRISRTETSNSNPQTTNCTYFVYNGNQVVADLDENGDLLRTYVWGPGIDNLLSFTDHTTSNTYYAIKDHQNTVIALVDDSGAVVESYEYSAYGETKVFNAAGNEISESALGNRYTFQGREIDWGTGLFYFRARWYDPAIGRWLSKDPIGIDGGLNLYVFVENNPINFNDPLGLCKDVEKLRMAYFDKIKEWIMSGKRRPGYGNWNGWKNNFQKETGIHPDYLGCWDQALLMAVHLTSPNIDTKSIWRFEAKESTIPPHHWIILKSSDSNDPDILVDPWANIFWPLDDGEE